MITAFGIAALLLIAFGASNNRRAIRWNVVLRALLLQGAIGAFVLFLPIGADLTRLLSDAILALLSTATAGIEMVFGPLADSSEGIVFAVHVLPVLIFFSSLMAVLYHIRLMPLVVRFVGGALQRATGASRVESLNAAANVFVGLTEAPLAVRPYLDRLSRAQFFCIMASGVASVAGSVLAAYVQMGVRLDYLLAASFMAAPGGLAMAKLLFPDTEPNDAAADLPAPSEQEPSEGQANVILAAGKGAADGLILAVNIGAMLIAFVSLIALANLLLGQLGTLFTIELSLQAVLGWLFAPVMLLLGVPLSEAQIAGALFGEKLVLNEFVAFFHLAEVADSLSPRSEAIVVFSLCGFANLAAIAVLLGGLGRLVPARREQIGKDGLRVVLAGSMSNLMSAALVGLMFAP